MNTYTVVAVEKMNRSNRKEVNLEANTVFYVICKFENQNPGWDVIDVRLAHLTKVE